MQYVNFYKAPILSSICEKEMLEERLGTTDNYYGI
jgi:hypothetical protein